MKRKATQAGIALSDANIHDAVKRWCNPDTREQVIDQFGERNAQAMTNMERLFEGQQTFNKVEGSAQGAQENGVQLNRAAKLSLLCAVECCLERVSILD